TEQVWHGLGSLTAVRGLPDPKTAEESVCIAAWPQPSGWSDEAARRVVDCWRDAIKAIRNLRAERNVPKDARIAPIIVAQGALADWLREGEPFLRSLPPAEAVTGVAVIERPAGCAVAGLRDARLHDGSRTERTRCPSPRGCGRHRAARSPPVALTVRGKPLMIVNRRSKSTAWRGGESRSLLLSRPRLPLPPREEVRVPW